MANSGDVGQGPEPLDVLVVGAGPTGLALAAALRSYGVRFRIVDRAEDRVHESRALAIQPRTLEVLAGFGVTDRFVESGNHAVRLRLHVGGRTISMPLFDIGVDDTVYPYLLFLSQAQTERVIGEYLADRDVTLERGLQLIGLRPADGEVTCRLRRPDEREQVVRARYVIGCDGAHSVVREQAGIGFNGRPYPQTFVLADLEADGIDAGEVHAFMAARGLLFFFPLGTPATWRVLAMRPPADTRSTDRSVTLDEVQALVAMYTSSSVRLHDPVWMTTFRLSNRGATRYRSGRVLLAGDAAHVHSPAGAQGMNTGIQDAVNLGWKLALVVTGRAGPALLDTYEHERAPVGRRVLRFTDRAFTVGTSANPLIRMIRIHLVPRLMPLAARGRRGRAVGFRTISQLAIHYRRSPLSTDGPHSPRRGPKPGDRLPDAPVTHAGRPGTLHASLAAPGFHLLLCGPADRLTTSAAALAEKYPGLLSVHRLTRGHDTGALIDHTGQAYRRLGLHDAPAHYLVRPDGHIGYRGGADLTGLHTYLRRWLTTP